MSKKTLVFGKVAILLKACHVTAGSSKTICILVADWSSVEASEPNACDVTPNYRPSVLNVCLYIMF